jgi:TrmH family RNA methyltransferase
MKKITSTSNEKIKHLKKLGNKKYRDKTGEFLVENLRIIYDVFQNRFKPKELFICEELLNKKDERLEYILDKFVDYFIIDNKVNKYYSSLVTPSGISAVYEQVERKINFDSIVVYLNNVSDPGNLGSILRTALAFNIENIVVDGGCVDIYNSKTISSAKDAILKLNIEQDKKLDIFYKIKDKMKIYSTRMDGGASIKNIKDKKFCLVFGNEANGVSEEILKLSDAFVSIEMSDKIESLNVGVSAGILFNEIFKN